MPAAAYLQEWFTQADAQADRLTLQELWARIQPMDVLRELATLILAREEVRLRWLWEQAHTAQSEAFFARAFQSSTPRRPGRDRLEPPEKVDGMTVLHHIRGMIGTALTIAEAREENTPKARRWLVAAFRAWTGAKEDSPSRLPAATPAGHTLSVLNSLLFQIADTATRTTGASGMAQDWLTALWEKTAPEDRAERAEETPQEGSRTAIASRAVRLLTYREDGSGGCGWLRVEAIPNGSGVFYPHPLWMALHPMSAEFVQTLETAYLVARRFVTRDALEPLDASQIDIRWWLEGEAFEPDRMPALRGGSHGAALTAVTAQLLRGEPVDPEITVTGTIADDAGGSIGAVSGISAKAAAAFRRPASALPPSVTRLLVVPEEVDKARLVASEQGLDPNNAVGAVTGLAELLAEISGWRAQLTSLCHQQRQALLALVSRQTQRPLPDWAAFERLYVEMRVEVEESSETPLRVVSWKEASRRTARALVLGDAGSGKTLLLCREVGERCEAALEQIGRGDAVRDIRLAVFVRAVDLAAFLSERPTAVFRDLLAEWVVREMRLRDSTRRLLSEQFHRGQCVLVLDALDEVAPAAYRLLLESLHTGCTESEDAGFLLSARPAGYRYRKHLLPRTEERTLLPFTLPQMEQAVRAWFHDMPEAGARLWTQIEGARPNVRRLLSAPLLLRLACRVFGSAWEQGQEPVRWQQRTELFRAYLDDAFTQWSARQSVTDSYQKSLLRGLFADFAYLLLEEGAHWHSWDRRTAEEIFRTLLPRYPGLRSRRLLDDFLESGPITVTTMADGTTAYLFTHLTIGEYLAAASLAERANRQGFTAIRTLLEEYAGTAKWQDVILFLIALLDQPTLLLDLLCAPDRDDELRHRHVLAAYCLQELLLTEPAPAESVR